MGHNFFFAYVVVLTMKVPWQAALGAVLLSGVIFVATASFGLRELIIAAFPESLKSAIAVGIGLLITLIGSGGFAVHEVITVEAQQVARTFTLYPVTSPALIVVGSLMIRSVREIEWDDFTEALPAFLTLVVMPLTFASRMASHLALFLMLS